MRALLLSLLLLPTQAFAMKCGVVDFERVAQDTAAGKAAQKRIEAVQSQRMAKLQEDQKVLEAEFREYQSQAAVLSAAEQQKREESLARKDQEIRLAAQQAQAEVQQAYMAELETLMTSFKAKAATLGQKGGYDLILDKSVVVYFVNDCRDLTTELVQAADAG